MIAIDYIVTPKENLKGTLSVAPDKSISHRAVMFGSISKGLTEIENFLTGDDCIATINCFREMGIEIKQEGSNVKIFGQGLHGLRKPKNTLDVQNSGTTIRLLSGILAGQNFETKITGDSSIEKRPMDRIIEPLRKMNANISGINNTTFAPLRIEPSKLKGINYIQKVASAQVKSTIILASLYTDEKTTIVEPVASRNHTELLLNYFGANIKKEKNTIIVNPVKELYGKKIVIPNDISSAAFFIVAGLICENSHLILKDVGVNETRIGIITALKQMGGQIEISNERIVNEEKIADLEIKSSKLKGIEIGGDLIPKMIDEIPIFAVAATFAKGTTTVKDAEELKVKESNRIKTVVEEFTKFGVRISETNDGMIINGDTGIKSAVGESYGDHRIAMSLAILALKAKNTSTIKNCDCVNVSFPNFFELLEGCVGN